MKFISFASRLAIMTVLAGATPVRAEDTSTPDPDAATVKLTAQAAYINAQTAHINAQTEKVKAQAAALGLPTVTGQTTLGDKAGATEARMLSSSAINWAAGTIAKDVDGKGPFLLLAKDQVVNLSLAGGLKGHIDTLSTASTQTLEACERAKADLDKPERSGGKKSLFTTPVTPAITPAVIGAVLGAFKVDTDIQGVSIEQDDAAFVNAVAAKIENQAVILPSEIVGLPSGGTKPAPDSVMGFWNKLAEDQRKLSDCRVQLAGKPESDARKAQIAEIDRQLTRIDAFASEVTASSTDAPSLLVRARQVEAIPADAKVLRVHVEHAGGSLIKRTTVLTAFGYPAIALTSGLVVSYRLTDPRTGAVLQSKLLVCRTARTRLGKVQEGKVGVAGCGQTTLAAQTEGRR